MNLEIIVAVEILDSSQCAELLQMLKQLPHVTALQWFDRMAEKGRVATAATPHIIVISDEQNGEDIFERIAALRHSFPHTAIFVLSNDIRPEHIIAVMKAGVTEYFPAPVKARILGDAVEKIRKELSLALQRSNGKTFAFLGAKGGLGATTLAVNFAVAFSLRSKKSTALMDMSLQSGDSSVLLDCMPQNSIYDACANIHRLDAAFLQSILVTHSSGVEFLAAPASPAQYEEIGPSQVRQILSLLQKTHEAVVVDCASSQINDCSLEVFNSASRIFLITDLCVTSIRDAARLMQLMLKLGLGLERIEIVVNRFIKGGELNLQDVERALKKRVLWLFPNDYENVYNSINTGVPLVSGRSQCPFSRNVSEFVEKIRQGDNSTQISERDYRGQRNFFGRAI